MEPNKIIIGARGSGKSTALEVDLLDVGIRRESAVVGFDRPGTLGNSIVGHLGANGLEHRTILEQARRTDRVLRSLFIKDSELTGLDRITENELQDEMFTQVYSAKRGLRTLEKNPYTNKYTKIGSAIFRSQRHPKRLDRYLSTFQRGTKEWDEMLRDARERGPVDAMYQLDIRSRRNPLQWETECGAAERIADCVKSPILWARHGPGINWTDLLKRKFQIYVDLSGITHENARALTIFMMHAVIHACRTHFDATGKPISVVIVLEEAGVMDTVTPFVLDSMRELRKTGVSFWVVSQASSDFAPETFEALVGQTECHILHHIDSGVDRGAELFSNPTWHNRIVHFSRERIVSDGVEEVQTHSTGRSKDHTGKVRTDQREGTVFLPRQRITVEEYFKSSEVHKQDWKTKLVQLLVGERLIHDWTGVRKEHVEPLGEPWPLGLTATRLPALLERLRNSPHLSPVEAEAPPCRKSAADRLGE